MSDEPERQRKITTRLPQTEFQAIKAFAFDCGCSVNALIRSTMTLYINDTDLHAYLADHDRGISTYDG